MASSKGFVDRETELASLKDALSKTLDGSGSVIFVAGEAGIAIARLHGV